MDQHQRDHPAMRCGDKNVQNACIAPLVRRHSSHISCVHDALVGAAAQQPDKWMT